MKILRGVLFAFGIVLLYLIVIIFFPVLKVPKQPFKRVNHKKRKPDCRRDVQFFVGDIPIRGCLYLPEAASRPVPCVIISTGFGGTKEGVIESYALRFVAAGMAALTYDYRHFGESGGEPRQVFDVLAQHDDLRAAVAYARGRQEIDGEKIALWGTSAAGGYGLIIAAEDPQIGAVISQCGAIDHQADTELFMKRDGIGYILRLLPHAQRDKGRSRLGLSPHTFPIVGKPGTVAMLTAPGAFEGYSRVVQHSETFKNEVCARLLLRQHGPDAVEAAKKVQCPVLFLACENDNLAAPDSHKRAAEALGAKAKVITYPIGHFDIYEGDYFEKAVGEMTAFLQEHLQPKAVLI